MGVNLLALQNETTNADVGTRLAELLLLLLGMVLVGLPLIAVAMVHHQWVRRSDFIVS